MKTQEQLDQRESETPRVVLKANSQCESQDLSSQEQDHLGKLIAMDRASGKLEATLWTTEFLAHPGYTA